MSSIPRDPSVTKHIESTSQASPNFTSWLGGRNQNSDMSFAAIVAATVVAITGLGFSSYLAWAALTSSKVAGCGAGQIFDCGHVLTSKWSTVMGIPVGLPAAILYVSVLGALFVSNKSASKKFRTISNNWLTIAAISAALAAVWFISLQLFVVEHLCSYCLAAHMCGLALAAIILFAGPAKRASRILLAGISGLLVAGLVTSQLFAEEPPTYEIETFSVPATTEEINDPSIEVFEAPIDFDAPIDIEAPAAPIENESTQLRLNENVATLLSLAYIQIPQTHVFPTAIVYSPQQGNTPTASAQQQSEPMVTLSGGAARLKINQWPNVGNANGKYAMVEMFDYTCPHCRANHQAVDQAKTLLGEQLSIVCLPVPLHPNCNPTTRSVTPGHEEACELAKLAVAVWRTDKSKFDEFHKWLFTGSNPPSYQAARQKAYTLVEQTKLDAELASTVPSQYVAQHVKLYQRVGAGTVPKMIMPHTTITGKITSPQTLIDVLRRTPGG